MHPTGHWKQPGDSPVNADHGSMHLMHPIRRNQDTRAHFVAAFGLRVDIGHVKMLALICTFLTLQVPNGALEAPG